MNYVQSLWKRDSWKRVGSGLLLLAAVLGLAVVAVQPAQGKSKERILRSFNGTDGSYPYATLVSDKEGNLYGTTYEGGAYGAGTVFELVKTGKAYKEKVLYSFTGGADGGYPYYSRGAKSIPLGSPIGGFNGGWSLVLDKSGNLYGTTAFGGACGVGTAFEVTPSGSETVLHSFCGGSDGWLVYCGLTMDGNGNLYGTTWVGGASNNGIVFELTPSGGTWTETVVYNLCSQPGCIDGAHSNTSLVMDTAGNLYGTTWWGGAYNTGTAFELTPTENGWTETTLWTFGNGDEGGNPSNLIVDTKGNLYGETGWGGTFSNGELFELTPTENGWTETVLYNFGAGWDGSGPYGGLLMDNEGNLYGSTFEGGRYGYGTVFEVTPSGTETILHSFTGKGKSGQDPWSGLVMDAEGNLYGTTMYGGAYGEGTVFKVTP